MRDYGDSYILKNGPNEFVVVNKIPIEEAEITTYIYVNREQAFSLAKQLMRLL